MRDRAVGWIFVAAQAVLLGALVVLPERDDWPTPRWVEWSGIVIAVAGVAVAALAGRRLGGALTPTPLPRAGAALATAGAYRYVRHPIYSGVLLVAAGLVLGSGSVWSLAVGLATWVFFSVKAAWEERHLRRRHPGYAAYAEVTPRFVPRVRTR